MTSSTEAIGSGLILYHESSKGQTKNKTSLCEIHNESVNVWSHLIGAIGFFSMIFIVIFVIGPHFMPLIYHRVQEGIRALLQGDATENSNPLILKLNSQDHSLINSVENIGYSISYSINQLIPSIECQRQFAPLVLAVYQMCPFITSKVEEFQKAAIELSQITQQRVSTLKMVYKKLEAKALQVVRNLEENVHIGPALEEIVELLKQIPKWPLIIHIISIIACLGFSSIYHLCYVHSKRVSSCLSRLDYGGISFLIAGTNVPAVLYPFYCDNTLAVTYLSLVVTFCVLAFVASLVPSFDSPGLRPVRGFMFIFVGLLGAVSITHAAFYKNGSLFYSFPPTFFAIGGACYIIGALIYIARFPERYFPNKFDIWGSSHQVWHFMILLAAGIHLYASIDFYHKRQYSPCLASDF